MVNSSTCFLSTFDLLVPHNISFKGNGRNGQNLAEEIGLMFWHVCYISTRDGLDEKSFSIWTYNIFADLQDVANICFPNFSKQCSVFCRQFGKWNFSINIIEMKKRRRKQIIQIICQSDILSPFQEIPNAFYREPSTLHGVLTKFSHTGRSPLVFIVSDSHGGKSNVLSLFPSDVQDNLGVHNIRWAQQMSYEYL